MDKYLHLPMFLYSGRNKWNNTVKEWTDMELATLWLCLHHALEGSESYEQRARIVYLIEKMYYISDLTEIDELTNDEYGNQTEEED